VHGINIYKHHCYSNRKDQVHFMGKSNLPNELGNDLITNFVAVYVNYIQKFQLQVRKL